MSCLEAQSQILAHGLTTDAAIEFFDALPKVEALMQSLEMTSTEEMLQDRREDRAYRYLEWPTARP